MNRLFALMTGVRKTGLMAFLLVSPLAVQAVTLSQISGTLVIGGAYTSLPAEIGGSMSLDSVVAGAGTNGDFLLSVTEGDTGVAHNNLSYPGVVVDPLFTIGGWQISVSNSVIDYQDVGLLYLSGSGSLACVDTALCGSFADTPMTWNLSAQSVGSGYSMVVTTVPVPAAAWLFGSGLIGLAGIARRKRG